MYNIYTNPGLVSENNPECSPVSVLTRLLDGSSPLVPQLCCESKFQPRVADFYW